MHDLRDKAMLDYIQENIDSDLKLSDVARQFHMSPSYLSRYFKQTYGVNFLEYVTKLRLEGVCRDLMLWPERNIARIAFDNGFTNMASFNKAFRQAYDRAPGALRSVRAGCHLKCSASVRTLWEKNWNKVINIGRLSSLLSSHVQEHVRLLKKELHFTYVRLWDIYSQELLLNIGRLRDGKKLDFEKMDRALDFLVENYIHPYIDLGFKPYLLLERLGRPLIEEERSRAFGNAGEFQYFLREFMSHYCKRYGTEEVDQWYFEMWYDLRSNKPDELHQYMEFFKAARSAIKAFAPEARLGGAGDDLSALLDNLKDDGEEKLKLLPLDFISVYYYGDDMHHGKLPDGTQPAFGPENGFEAWISQTRMACESSGLNVAEFHVSEWGMSVSNRNVLNDSYFRGAYIVKNCIDLVGKADTLGCWLGSDLYSEFLDTHSILFGGAGLISRHGIKKPAFYAFSFLNKLGPFLLGRNDYAIVTAAVDDAYFVVCHNYVHPRPEEGGLSERTDKASENWGIHSRKITVDIDDVDDGSYNVKVYQVNSHWGSVYDEWQRLRALDDFSREDIDYLRNVSAPRLEVATVRAEKKRLSYEMTLEPNEFRYLHIYKKKSV